MSIEGAVAAAATARPRNTDRLEKAASTPSVSNGLGRTTRGPNSLTGSFSYHLPIIGTLNRGAAAGSAACTGIGCAVVSIGTFC